MKDTFYCLLMVILVSLSGNAQNMFPEKFEGCDTEQFAIESKTIQAKIAESAIIDAVKSGIEIKALSRISGVLTLQVLVDTDGTSCLISLENKTNVSTKKLQLKQAIDSLIWSNPAKKVAAIVALKFDDGVIQMRRMGFDGNQGWHQLKEN